MICWGAYRTWLARPSSWVWGPSGKGRRSTRMGGGNVEGRGDKAQISGIERKGKERGG